MKFHLGLGGVKINPFDFSRAKFDALRLGRAKFDRFRTLGAKILNFIRFEIFSANFAAIAAQRDLARKLGMILLARARSAQRVHTVLLVLADLMQRGPAELRA